MKLFGDTDSSYPMARYYSYSGSVLQNKVSIALAWQWRIYLAALFILDALMVGLAFRVAYTIRFDLQFSIFYLDTPPDLVFYQQLAAALLLIWLALFAVTGLYKRRNLLGGVREYASVFRVSTVAMLLVVTAGFLVPEFILARGWLLISWALVILLVSFGRFCMRRVVYLMRYRGYFLDRGLIVGSNDEAQSLVTQLAHWPTSGLQIMGFVDDNTPAGEPIMGSLRALGGIDRIDELIDEFEATEVIIATSAVTRTDIVAVFKQYGLTPNVNLRLSTGLFEVITTGLSVKEMAHVPLVEVHKVRLTGIDRVLKLLLDYTAGALTMLVAGPLMLIIALMLRFDSPGPVIYRRRVMGINGRQFDAFKFRTMHVDGDEILAQHPELQAELAANHKLKDDPRVTRIGRFLRKYSLDELPQLFNVFKREMSLVGPRMISPPEMEEYGKWGMNLLTVAPGITGLWQVSGRSDVSYQERVRLDMHYVRNWSIWLDLQILLQTIPAVATSRGAY